MINTASNNNAQLFLCKLVEWKKSSEFMKTWKLGIFLKKVHVAIGT